MSKLIVLLCAAIAMPSVAFAQSPLQPGLWEITTKPYDIVPPPGVPPQIAAMMRNGGKTAVVQTCVTPEQAKLGPDALMKADSTCKYSRYDLTSGTLKAVAICTRPSGTMQITSTAHFTDSSFTQEGEMQVLAPASMSMKFTASGKLIGSCR